MKCQASLAQQLFQPLPAHRQPVGEHLREWGWRPAGEEVDAHEDIGEGIGRWRIGMRVCHTEACATRGQQGPCQ